MPYRRSSAFALTLTGKCPAHRAIRLVYRIFFMEYFKKKRRGGGKRTQRHSRETKALVTVIVYLTTLNLKRTKENIA